MTNHESDDAQTERAAYFQEVVKALEEARTPQDPEAPLGCRQMAFALAAVMGRVQQGDVADPINLEPIIAED